jgi:serine/threonine protein kinase
MWRQGEFVRPVEVPKSFLRETVYLSDFGMGIKAGTEVRNKLQSPIAYCAPERFHNINPSFASDMWSYMCLLTEFYIGHTPWLNIGCASLMTRMADILGPLPKQWEGHYNVGRIDHSWYDRNRTPSKKTLEAMIRRARPEVSTTELNHVLSIVSKGFCCFPEDRITATLLLQDASFKAVMEIYGL